jgi:nitroreductase
MRIPDRSGVKPPTVAASPSIYPLRPMSEHPLSVEDAIRTRRTHKAYQQRTVERAILDELFELARWAPNHHLTNPWRFRVLGSGALARLKAAAEAQQPGSASKLDRAPTLVAVTSMGGDDAEQAREDLLSSAIAAYIVLLGAHARGLAGYWRTPAVLDSPQGRAAIGLDDEETTLGLLYLGYPREAQRIPERAPVGEIVRYLD